MASIHKRTKSPYWCCYYLSADGRWLKRSTKLKDKKKALEWCVALQGAQDLIGRGSASEAQLRAIIDATMVRVTGNEVAMPTVREWLNQWVDAKDGTNTPLTITKYRQSMKEFLEYIGQKADTRLESVTQRDIIDFRNHLRKEGKTPATVNQLVAKIVSGPFRQAFAQGLIKHNPTAGLPALKDTEKKRREAFTIEQVRQLLKVAKGEWRGATLLGYTSGMRLGDVVKIRWENVDFDQKVIAFRQGKTQSSDSEATVIGLHPDFEDYLAGQKVRPLEGSIFPTLAPMQSSGRSGL